MTMDSKATDQMLAMLDALKAENEKLKALVKTSAKTGMKVSDKGALSLYGLGRFPITLYRSQWESLLDKSTEIRGFIADNATLLKVKGE